MGLAVITWRDVKIKQAELRPACNELVGNINKVMGIMGNMPLILLTKAFKWRKYGVVVLCGYSNFHAKNL